MIVCLKGSNLQEIISGYSDYFTDKDYEMSGLVLELFVDNPEETREILLDNGCKIISWKEKGQDCYIQDPFGVIFNLWED